MSNVEQIQVLNAAKDAVIDPLTDTQLRASAVTVVLNQVRASKVDQTTTISTTTETTVLTAAASTYHDLTQVMVANTSLVDVRVDFRDTTAGSVRFSLMCKAGVTTGFTTTDPVIQTTVNTNWTATLATAVTDLRIFIKAVKNT